jgi:hypothetical protein
MPIHNLNCGECTDSVGQCAGKCKKLKPSSDPAGYTKKSAIEHGRHLAEFAIAALFAFSAIFVLEEIGFIAQLTEWQAVFTGISVTGIGLFIGYWIQFKYL